MNETPAFPPGHLPIGSPPVTAGRLALAAAHSSRPYRHDFYLAIWIGKGVGEHIVDFQGYEIRPDALHFVRPGQVHIWASTAPLTGYFVAFDERIFRRNGLGPFFQQLAFLSPVSAPPFIQLAPEEAVETAQLFQQIVRASQESAWGQEMAILSWLTLLLLRGQRRCQPAVPHKASEKLTHDFIQLVEENAIQEHRLQGYSEQLGVTIGHLTEMVKRVRGQSAGALVRQRILLEAKRLLVHSDLTVSQIAHQLNFKDPSYFGRFFKREANQTPRQFRDTFNRAPTP